MSGTTEYPKPLPRATLISKPFWDGLREEKLLVQRCRACGRLQHYPRPHCIGCLSTDIDWVQASGRGTVYSYTVVRRAAHPAFAADVPYIFAVIELEEGPHVAGNVVDAPLEAVRIGMPVTAVFDHVTPDVTLLKWRPGVEGERTAV